jgi:undecaprenyl-diphosphatase
MWDALATIDLALMGWLRTVHTPWLDALMTWISAGGGAGRLWLALAAVALVRPRDRAAAWRVLLAVGLSYLLVDAVLKPVIDRPRPTAEVAASAPRALPPLPSTASFPSGHATASFSAAVTVSRMWPRTAPLWWALALAIGYSRIYLGHHYPLDILGGAILGTSIGWWVLGGAATATSRLHAPSETAGPVRG